MSGTIGTASTAERPERARPATANAADAALELAIERDAMRLRIVLGQLMRKLRQQGGFDELTRTQTSVLSRLAKHGPATAAELARSEGIRPQSMTAVIAALETAGHIERTPDPADGRKSVLSITASTQRQFDSKLLARDDWLTAAISSELGDDERRVLEASIDILGKLAAHE